MEYSFEIKYVRISPKKLLLYLNSIKKIKPKKALAKLSMHNSRASYVLYKAIKNAVDSVVNNHKIPADQLNFKNIIVNQGPGLKRHRAGPKGMVRPYKKRSSRIKIILRADNNKISSKPDNKINQLKSKIKKTKESKKQESQTKPKLKVNQKK